MQEILWWHHWFSLSQFFARPLGSHEDVTFLWQWIMSNLYECVSVAGDGSKHSGESALLEEEGMVCTCCDSKGIAGPVTQRG